MRTALLRVLAQIGGPNALWTVRCALDTTDAAIVDAAIRALCDWPDQSALESLVPLAQTTDSQTHRILTLRACFRMLGDSKTIPHDDKLATYRQLMAIADRPDERKQALTGIASVPSVGAIPLIKHHLTSPQTKTEAALALAKLARNLIAAHRDEAVAIAKEALAATDNETVRKEAQTAIKLADEMADYLMSWLFAGPYLPKPEQKAADLLGTVLSPEQPDSEDVEWRTLPVGQNPDKPWSLDLRHAMGGDDRAAYLRTYVRSPVDQPARLEVGSDDAVKVWLNRRRVHTNPAFRSLKPGEDKISIVLYKGWNELLMKVVQGGVDWEACAKIVNRDGTRLEGLRIRAELSQEQLPHAVTDPPAEAVLAWHMDEGDGDLKAASGRGGNGKLIGEPARVAGVSGSCLSFDAKDDVVESDTMPSLPTEAGDAWSMNVFVHVDQQPEELTMLAGFGDVKDGRPTGCQRYLVMMHGGIHFWAASVDVNAKGPFDLGKWQMITITFDGHLLTIYKNAKALISSAVKLADAAPLARLAPLDHWRKKNRFAGKIDEFTIWKGVLTQAQMDALAAKLPSQKDKEN